MPATNAKAVLYDDLITWLTSNHQRRIYQACAASGLTPTQYFALTTIRELAEPKMSALAARLGLTPGAVTTLLDRLEKQGLAERSPDPQDRRITVLRVRPKGAEACARTDAMRRDQSLQAFGHLSADQQEQVLIGLTALTRAWPLVSEVVP